MVFLQCLSFLYSFDLEVLYGGVDGQKFEVGSLTLKARRSKKYFGKGKGVVAYTLLANHIHCKTELIRPMNMKVIFF